MSKASQASAAEAADKKAAELAALATQNKAASRMLRLRRAKDSLISFTRLMMPDPTDPDDTELSRYKPVRHHEIIAAALEEVEAGRMLRLIITMPPRAGKTELCSKKFVPWLLGRDSYRHVIFATYNEEFARDIGKEVRDTMRTAAYGQVFPLCSLRAGSAAADRVQTREGGIASFVGKGGSITGRGADILLIDDPVKDREEADSKAQREKLWAWFTQVAMTRLMDCGSAVVLVMTRWHEDDIIGRLTDPTNEAYNAEEAAKWKILALPAIAVDGDPMGRIKGEPLWPERFSLDFLHAARRLDPKGFAALYQGNPSPDDGDFFKKEWLHTYGASDLPKNLRHYCASDHAVSTAENRDATCLLPVGLDEEGTVWVLPDVWWRRAKTDDVVDAMLDMMERNRPLMWWAENGHISKSIGPFLRKRMLERNIFCAIDEVTPAKDKQTRAQSIQGRMAMGRVRFPRFAPWWGDASGELLKFPSARHDDFVDALSWIGLGLAKSVAASRVSAPKQTGPRTGTLAWVKSASRNEEKQRRSRQHGF